MPGWLFRFPKNEPWTMTEPLPETSTNMKLLNAIVSMTKNTCLPSKLVVA